MCYNDGERKIRTDMRGNGMLLQVIKQWRFCLMRSEISETKPVR
ncbi:hypothetical protein DDI_3450 [Dickeya dianthicola RNS04.9]|nr:hypothetical protein DDI_3450 [Dickeya dianthicola RNS04.9]